MTREHKRKLKVLGMIVHSASVLGDYTLYHPSFLIQEIVDALWRDWKLRMKNRRTKWVDFNRDEERLYVTGLITKPLCEHLMELPPEVLERLERICHEDCECEEESSLNSAPGWLAPAGTCRECAKPCSTGSDYCDPCYNKLYPATQ